MKTIATHTLGCKLNYVETSAISDEFIRAGFSQVDFNDRADIYLINTCTVTENADKECRQIIRRALRNNPEAFIAVVGCYAQLRPNEIASIHGVDLVLGTKDKFNLLKYYQEEHKTGHTCIYVSDLEQVNQSVAAAVSRDEDTRTRAFLKIQDGCDYKCSFCTIPLARGASRSVPADEIIKDLEHLVSVGFKEIILTGVNIGDYRIDHSDNLYSLLKKCIKIAGEFRIRLSSVEPNLLSDNIVELIASENKLCDHFHIPLQSGSNEILKKMQRRYGTDIYADRIHRINKTIPDAGIGVDVIVGFPGETDTEFQETFDFIQSLPISYLHVFTYSERPDTKALLMPGGVEHSIRKERNKMLRRLGEQKRFDFHSSMIGKHVEVLFEQEVHNGWMRGLSGNYLRVSAPYDPKLVNTFYHTKILKIENDICYGG